MPVSFDHNFIFVHIPKTGGTSIRKGLMKIDPYISRWSYHTYIRTYRNVLHEKLSWPKMFKFTFVRNPWGRAVSYYTWLRGMESKRLDKSIWEKTKNTPFKKFIQTMQIQFEYIHIGNEMVMDYVGKTETFEESLKEISDRIGIEVPCYHERISDHRHYTEYYDDETKKIVASRCEKVIDLFGYTFGEKEIKSPPRDFTSHSEYCQLMVL